MGGDVTQNTGTGNICIGSNNNLAGAPPNTIAIGNNIGAQEVQYGCTLILGSSKNPLNISIGPPLPPNASLMVIINGNQASIPITISAA